MSHSQGDIIKILGVGKQCFERSKAFEMKVIGPYDEDTDPNVLVSSDEFLLNLMTDTDKSLTRRAFEIAHPKKPLTKRGKCDFLLWPELKPLGF